MRRPADEERLRAALGRMPIVLLTGPRQAGKSTLARVVVEPAASNLFDLEDPRDLARMGEPTLSLPGLSGTVIIDEAQRRKDLFPVLRVLADEQPEPGRFLVLGSASPGLVGLASESLAGRVALIELGGLRVSDLGAAEMDRLWLRGGFPRSALAGDEHASAAWRDDFIATFLERDLANLGFRLPAATLRRFWTMLAHYHAQTWNGAELSRALGVSESTVRRYLDALSDALVVRQLQPWFANISKRQVRAPKVYIRDSGLLHRLLGVASRDELLGHPKVGASWEGFVIEQILQMDIGAPWFWATHAGAEIDLVTMVDGTRVGIEVKRTDQPRLTPSIRHALDDLDLERLVVVHAGPTSFQLADRVVAVNAAAFLVEGLPAALRAV
ncbi:MAG TPA: ATP-binding protein [Acidimicrobiales bacterium]|nr:ATP-binding protein [Acidimicrobiales bacterium]